MSLSQQLAQANDPMFDKGMSEYEKARILNIRKNEAALRALGLDCASLTTLAQGDKVPLKKNKSHPPPASKNTCPWAGSLFNTQTKSPSFVRRASRESG